MEFETDSSTLAPEPALYETAYVTSHKGNCRAGCFSADGQLIATGSVDASIKILDVDRMLAKSAPDELDPSRAIEQQGHPVIRFAFSCCKEKKFNTLLLGFLEHYMTIWRKSPA